MDFASALLDEALGDKTYFLVAGVILLSAAVRSWATAERSRLRAVVILTVLHLALLPIAAGLAVQDNAAAYKDVHFVSLVFAVLAGMGIVSTLLFSVMLRRIGFETPPIVRDVFGAAATVIVLITLAQHSGFPLSGVITTSAVLTAVIGFSLQDTLGNIMGGLALQMDNSIQVGDWIKVGDLNGKVTQIRWRYTAIETRNWETMVVPNSVLMKGQVIVLGRRTGKPLQWRRWVYFNVDFRYSPTDVIDPINESLQAAPIERVAADPAPHCILMDIQETYGHYAVRYWLTDIAVDDPTDSQVRIRIYFALKRAGIPLSIPAHAIFTTDLSEERKAHKQQEERSVRLKALGHVELFDDLGDADRAELAAGLRYAPFARGETMTRQGAEGHWLYMILEGEATVRVRNDAGLDQDVARLKAGSFFGEMSLLTGAPRSATVVAVTDCECYRLDKAAFQGIIQARPELADSVAAVLAKRRVELLAVRENLDAAARARRVETDKLDIVGKIRDFFALSKDKRRTG